MSVTTNNEFKLTGPKDKQAALGSAATLSCHLSPGVSAVAMEIRWFKGTDCVCLYKNAQMIEGRGYEGRVSISTQDLEMGDVSLQLKECRESDIGLYLCQVITGDKAGEATVRVWWRPLRRLSRTFVCGVIPYVSIQQWGRKWTEEERMKMVESALLTEYKTDVKSLIKEFMKNHSTMEKTEKDLRNTKAELEQAAVKLQDKSRQLQDMTALLEQQQEKETLRTVKGGNSEYPLVPVPKLRLVLLGRTGSGKSAAANTILGREERSQAGTSTVTQQSESRQGEVAGRKVTVVDTPDWFCPKLSLEEVRQDVGRCVRLSAPGPHAFLLVIPVNQPTGEEAEMLEKMEEIFGEIYWRNTMILCTVTDANQRRNTEDFVPSGNQEVQRLVEKCGNRFHCLNINESGDGSQVSELLQVIEKMVEGNGKRFYSSDIYLETESQIRELERKIILQKEVKRDAEKGQLKEKLDKEFQGSKRKIEGIIQEQEEDIRQFLHQANELEKILKEEQDEERKKEIESDLQRVVDKKTKLQSMINILKEKIEWDKKEVEIRQRREMEKISEMYETKSNVHIERDFLKLILPEIQQIILVSKSDMQEEFSRQMEEKDRELEMLTQRLSELREALLLRKGVCQTANMSTAQTESRDKESAQEMQEAESLMNMVEDVKMVEGSEDYMTGDGKGSEKHRE